MCLSRWRLLAAAGLVVTAAGGRVATAQSPRLQEILAAERGETPEVRALVAGKDPNARDKPHRRTALMWSIILNDGAAFDRFIAVPGADVDAEDDRGETALSQAAQFGMKHNTTPMVEALLGKGADVSGSTEPNGLTPLMHAANGNVLGVARALLARIDPREVDRRSARGRTALVIGASVGAADIVRLLLEKGAQVDGVDEEGKTPLIHAAGRRFPGTLATVELLLGQGADPNARDKLGNTALSQARQYGPPGVVELLQKAGAK
jgi:ankyrin repeat protein